MLDHLKWKSLTISSENWPFSTSIWLSYHGFMTFWPFGLCESIFLTTCAYFRIKILIKHSRKFVNCSIGMFPSIFWPSVLLLYQVPSSIFMTKYSRSWQPGWMLAAQNIWGCNRPEYGGLKLNDSKLNLWNLFYFLISLLRLWRP